MFDLYIFFYGTLRLKRQLCFDLLILEPNWPLRPLHYNKYKKRQSVCMSVCLFVCTSLSIRRTHTSLWVGLKRLLKGDCTYLCLRHYIPIKLSQIVYLPNIHNCYISFSSFDISSLFTYWYIEQDVRKVEASRAISLPYYI